MDIMNQNPGGDNSGPKEDYPTLHVGYRQTVGHLEKSDGEGEKTQMVSNDEWLCQMEMVSLEKVIDQTVFDNLDGT